MGFLCNNQQRIALSHLAATVLESDCLLFGCMDKSQSKPSMHAMINRIFQNSFDRSDASIEMRILRQKETYLDLYGKNLSGEVKNFTDRLLKKERRLLTDKIERLLSAAAFVNRPVSLNNETMKILAASHEDAFYRTHPARYIRAVLEEYASLDSLTRKEIYFRQTIEQLERHARECAVIEIKYVDNPNRYRLIPAFIRPDIYRTHLYLAGFSCQEGACRNPVSCRIDGIETIQYIRPGSPSPSFRALEKAVKEQGIQYLSGQKSHIRIRLSREGISKYRRLTFQRPPFTSIEGAGKDIYVFDIPEYQAQVYFFKFGRDAVILEPETLKQDFINRYREALAAYGAPHAMPDR